MSEKKITFTKFDEGVARLDLSNSGLSVEDMKTLHEWMEYHRQREREQIIALLEAELTDFNNVGDGWHEGFKVGITTAIALIKGENE